MRFDMHNLKVIPYPLYDIHFVLYLIVSMLGDPSPPTGVCVCVCVYVCVCVLEGEKFLSLNARNSLDFINP